MDPLTADDAANALAALADTAVDKENDILQYSATVAAQNSDDENDLDNPNFDAFYEQGKSDAIVKVTNFNVRQFQGIWDMFQDDVRANWNVGRGRKSGFKAKDVFFKTLTTLKHAGQWDFLARMFNIKAPTFERLITGFIEVLWEVFYERLVINLGTKYRMNQLIQNGTTFKNFKFALYATDVTFQQCNRPSGNIEEAKKYFSGKHKLYGYKVEVSVLPNGIAVFCSPHHPGSVSGIDIMYQIKAAHGAAVAKSQTEISIADVGQLSGQYPDLSAVLADKGYQAAVEFLRCIHPKKKPRMGFLTLDEERYNKLVSSDGIIVENFLVGCASCGQK